MNNSKLAIERLSLTVEKEKDFTPLLRQKEGELIEIIDSLQKIQNEEAWSSLKTRVFDSLTSSLERDIASEGKKENPNPLRLRFLAGELKWAERFSDLKKLGDAFRVELTNVRKQLYGKTEKGSI